MTIGNLEAYKFTQKALARLACLCFLRCILRYMRTKCEICSLVVVENTRSKMSTLQSFFVEGYQTKDLNMNTASDG